MKNAFLKFIAIVAVHVVCITAAQTQTPTRPNRPATVPPGYVITPFGYFHPNCVVHLAEGDELRPAQHVILHADGTTSPMPACGYPHYRADGETVHGDERGVYPLNIIHSWIVGAECVAGSTTIDNVPPCGTAASSFTALSAQWSVPPAPASNDGQTLAFFPGLEDISVPTTAILQPVLAWNDDFTSAWGIASWNCCINGTSYESTPQQVSSGDTINGLIGCHAYLGGACILWNITINDLENGGSSEFKFASDPSSPIFNWAFAGVLEVYNIQQCSDFPPNGSISFNNIQLESNVMVIQSPTWAINNFLPVGSTPQCSYSGQTGQAQVILTWAP
jgi:hypothetical protein